MTPTSQFWVNSTYDSSRNPPPSLFTHLKMFYISENELGSKKLTSSFKNGWKRVGIAQSCLLTQKVEKNNKRSSKDFIYGY